LNSLQINVEGTLLSLALYCRIKRGQQSSDGGSALWTNYITHDCTCWKK